MGWRERNSRQPAKEYQNAHLEAKQAGREEKHQRETDGQTFHGWHNEGMR
jgi:hypothetical protein